MGKEVREGIGKGEIWRGDESKLCLHLSSALLPLILQSISLLYRTIPTSRHSPLLSSTNLPSFRLSISLHFLPLPQSAFRSCEASSAHQLHLVVWLNLEKLVDLRYITRKMTNLRYRVSLKVVRATKIPVVVAACGNSAILLSCQRRWCACCGYWGWCTTNSLTMSQGEHIFSSTTSRTDAFWSKFTVLVK